MQSFSLGGKLACAVTVSGAGRIIFKAVERLQVFDPGGIIVIFDLQFSRCVVCHVCICIKNGTFNHCGRSKAWNSTHHGRYVFQTAFFFCEK